MLVVFIGMLAFIINSYVLEQRVLKQKSLFYQLMVTRQGINLFTMIEKRFPESLVELGIASYKMPGDNIDHRYIDRFPINSEGAVLDPFGNPYKYDKKLGWVQSMTEGYEFW